jgi:hypothetical protein
VHYKDLGAKMTLEGPNSGHCYVCVKQRGLGIEARALLTFTLKTAPIAIAIAWH